MFVWWARRRGAPLPTLHYFIAEKRLSNELDGTIGVAPATSESFAAGPGAGSDSVGLTGGRAEATGVSAGLGAGLGAAAGRCASMTFGLAGTAVAVVSLARPTLRARLEKKP